MVVRAVQDVRGGQLALHLRPGWLVLSAGAVLLAYLVLIRTWVYIVTGLSGQTLGFVVAARIWFVSNLGTLLPGRIWGIVQMGAMSAEQGISPVAAGAASVINAAVNIASGMAVGAISGAPIIATYLGWPRAYSAIVAVLAVIGVCLLPVLLPLAFRIARDQFGASVPTDRPPARVIVVSAMANMVAWVLYGVAFLCLARGVVDGVGGSVWDHTAAFATSYVIGYLAFISPAGLGFREKALTYVLTASGLAAAPQALALSLVSRLWLLIIQVLPALLFLAYRRRPPNEKAATG
jgi:hypothetical protein